MRSGSNITTKTLRSQISDGRNLSVGSRAWKQSLGGWISDKEGGGGREGRGGGGDVVLLCEAGQYCVTARPDQHSGDNNTVSPWDNTPHNTTPQYSPSQTSLYPGYISIPETGGGQKVSVLHSM